MISYEASKWYIKIWRQRWYICAFFLHIFNNIKLIFILDYIIDEEIDEKEGEKLREKWKDIKKHVELTKMNKYS
jgi:membrane-anchored glycerophosphoryl diester phosphodiesterase (GDPDase)